MLRGQDIAVILKIVSQEDDRLSFATLAVELSMSPSEVHQAVKRSTKCGLMNVDASVRGSHLKTVNRQALLEFLVHGLKYVFPAELGPETRGVPTCLHAPGLRSLLSGQGNPTPVWPWPQGTVRGYELKPLYRSVPAAALADPNLHKLLALADAIRAGRARERAIAADRLTSILV